MNVGLEACLLFPTVPKVCRISTYEYKMEVCNQKWYVDNEVELNCFKLVI